MSTKSHKKLAAEESKEATRSQNAALAKAKSWRRRASRRANRAAHLGEQIPDGLLRYSSARTVPGVVGQMTEMLKMFESVKDKLPGAGTDELLAEGRHILDALSSADASQEQKRLRELPDAMKNYFEHKGRLYLALKAINDAGRELHEDNPLASSAYNMSILKRRAGKKEAKKEEKTPA